MTVEQLVRAIRSVAHTYGCDGTPARDLISEAMENLADKIAEIEIVENQPANPEKLWGGQDADS